MNRVVAKLKRKDIQYIFMHVIGLVSDLKIKTFASIGYKLNCPIYVIHVMCSTSECNVFTSNLDLNFYIVKHKILLFC